jgi:ubiquinone/menaquinone biosynthesis C-methylase UbiE
VNGSPNVVGNTYDKYETRNPIARALVTAFLDTVADLYRAAAPRTVLEVGCGEGELAARLFALDPSVEELRAVDVSLDRLHAGLPDRIVFETASVYSLPFPDRRFDLVVCCEVLEHLHDPAAGLAELARVARSHVLVSTPWEPIWRAMNIARGRYLRDLGNTPGHVQHFTRRGLLRLVRTRLAPLAVRRPLPWTVVLGRPLP